MEWQQAMMSRARVASRKARRNTTTALTDSPRYASRTPITQASRIAGWRIIRLSTSAGQTLKPDASIMRLRRSVLQKWLASG